MQKHLLEYLNTINIWQMSAHLSCGDIYTSIPLVMSRNIRGKQYEQLGCSYSGSLSH